MSGLAVVAAGGWGLVAVLVLAMAVARAAARRRDGLLARAAHEVRGPLGAARLALDAAARDARPARGLVAAADAELERAVRGLADLESARRGRRGPDRAELVRVDALVARHAPAWETLAAAHGAALAVDVGGAGSAEVRADPVRLAQAVGNLVVNAAEHGRGVVRVGVRVTGGHVAVDVCDDGPGVSVVPLRGTPPSAADRGHGLGVAVEVAASGGGTVAAVPRPPGARGGHLTLELPRASHGAVARPPGVGRGVLVGHGSRR